MKKLRKEDIDPNGDDVEVDANNGTIRVLSRATTNPFGAVNQWQRLFRVQGLRFLVSDIWMDHYKSLGALVIFTNDEFTSYLPRITMARLLAEGKELLSSDATVDVYETTFRAFMRDAQALQKEIIDGECERATVESAFRTMAALFSFYYRTEFFSTDDAYKQFETTKDAALGARLERMGVLKNDGRSLMNSLFFGSDSVLPRLLQNLERQFGVPNRELQQYSRSEILALFDGMRVSPADIANRDAAFYVWGTNGVCETRAGVDAHRAIGGFGEESPHALPAFVRGTVARAGKVRGIARIIRAGYDNFDSLRHVMESMQQGDILVAETTSPELMPACQKAGAIVTDQGGMLSHAAIVSRELQVPCVVATGNATEVIKDGDLIEVDAEKGIVTIVERA